MKKWTVPAAFVAAAAMITVGAPAAFAASTECTTELADETVTGDLVVPAGATCVLGGTTVTGSIVVNEDGWLDATEVVVGGDVIGTDTYGILIDGASVAGDVSSFSTGTREGFLYLYDLEVTGSVDAGGIDVEVSDTSIDGSFSTAAASYVDLLRTSVAGDASIADSPFGATVSGAIVGGSLSVSGSSRDVLVGALADGGLDQWGNTVGRDLVLTGNTANLQVAGTVVVGSIQLDGNTPAANLGAGNSAGGVTGDHTGDGPAPGLGADDQAVAVVVPEQLPGEFIWSLDSTGRLVDMGVAEEMGDHFEATGEIAPVRVTDTRAEAPAWSVSAQVSDFVAGGTTLDGKHLGWAPKLLENEGQAVAGAAVPSGFDEGEGLSVPRNLGRAEAGHALGSSVLGADLTLKLPLGVDAGTYTATLTLTALS
ncbi:hypothetical protein [Sanguibacter sp. 25GB23B1]|uniref:hypothetical protein n=1 Tax=unclassified Sanguibacter TaxID=2645534 RepID=UPI0032AFCF49